jgi:hypothetical protein
MRGLHICVGALCLFLASCDKSGPGDPGSGGVIQSVRFDLGTRSIYAWSVSQMDSAGIYRPVQQDTFQVRVVGMGETLGTFTNLTRLELSEIHGSTGLAYCWFQIGKEQLVEIASSGAGRVPVISPRLSSMQYAGGALAGESGSKIPWILSPFALTRNKSGDSVIVRGDPRIVYQYPLKAGQLWVSFSDPFQSARSVIGVEDLAVTGGTFRCAKVKTTVSMFDSSFVWYDYVAADGLIMRVIQLTAPVTTTDDPSSSILIRSQEKLELIQRSSD